ncbi:ABC transporter ATP-binding protein [Lactococcus formosensis]|uniref:ABC transporter ATP-binding protein n=1 Tax=Lactococcus formosensis TaxID=1281486 RepID=UPI00324617A6
MRNLLTLKNASFSYNSDIDKDRILDNINYSFHEGTMYSIVAPSGTGKTTLISILAGLENLSEGELFFNNQEVFDVIGIENYRKNFSSIIFQAYNLIPYMTALENVLTAMYIQKDSHSPKSKKDYIEKAIILLEDMGLTEKQIYSSVLKLSGGQQQRVAIARALSSNAPIIFADEPTGNLDSETSKAIVNILKNLAHEKNKCIIIVTHDERIAAESDVTLTIKSRKVEEIV